MRFRRRLTRIALSLGLGMSLLVGLPATGAEAAPPQFTETDCEGLSDSVFRLYTAALGRPAEQAGYEFWLDSYQTGGHSLVTAAEFFVISEEFSNSYGSLNNRQFVEQLYRNVLGRDGEPGGVDFWTGQIDSGARSRAIVLLDFSESPENVERSQTNNPSLGFFNRGLDGPWTCTPQPANDACTVHDQGFPTYDMTVQVPAGFDADHAHITIDIFRGSEFLDSTSFTVHYLEPGRRARHTQTKLIAATNGVPASELTCVVTSLEPTEWRVAGDPTFVDPSSATCVVGAPEQPDFGHFVTGAAPNPLGVPADGNYMIAVFVDGFRVAANWARADDVPAGATGEILSRTFPDAIPDNIDTRRVTCEVLGVYWKA